MLERITDLPDFVLGFNARGEVSADDYRRELVPAVERALIRSRKLRLLYVLGDGFTGLTAAAAWEDTKIGFGHLTRFDRIAVVTDIAWIDRALRAFRFLVPLEIRVYGNRRLDEARRWITEPIATGRLAFEFREPDGLLILRPHGPLDATDFERVAAAIDPYVEQHGKLLCVMIVTAHFPGWGDLAAFAAHARFVKDHRKKISRLALVSSDHLVSALPQIADYFLVQEARHFPIDGEDRALEWLNTGIAMRDN